MSQGLAFYAGCFSGRLEPTGRAITLAVLALILSGCGGGGGSDTSTPQTVVLVDADSTVSGAPDPGETKGRSQWSPRITGPSFVLSQAASVKACVEADWAQKVTADTLVLANLDVSEPLAQSNGTLSLAAANGATILIPMKNCVTFNFSAGPRTTAVSFRVRTGGGATYALGSYSAVVRWKVTATYQ